MPRLDHPPPHKLTLAATANAATPASQKFRDLRVSLHGTLLPNN